MMQECVHALCDCEQRVELKSQQGTLQWSKLELCPPTQEKQGSCVSAAKQGLYQVTLAGSTPPGDHSRTVVQPSLTNTIGAAGGSAQSCACTAEADHCLTQEELRLTNEFGAAGSRVQTCGCATGADHCLAMASAGTDCCSQNVSLAQKCAAAEPTLQKTRTVVVSVVPKEITQWSSRCPEPLRL